VGAPARLPCEHPRWSHLENLEAATMKLYRDFSTQEEIDAQYNPELSVPDLKPYIEFFSGESQRARRALDCALDLRFGPTIDETVDVFPAASPGSPVVVFIHGGYWRRLSSKEFSLAALGLVPAGCTVVVTNYSLCPKVRIDEITRQSRAVIAWLAREAGVYNGDADRIFVCGHSAGGQQVGMLVATDWTGAYGLPENILKGGIPISGIFDLAPLRYSWLQPKVVLDHETIVRESPMLHIPDAGPPLLVTLGGDESEEFHRQSRDYLDAWCSRGLRGESFAQPGKNHFNAIEGLAEPESALCRSIVEFVSRCEEAG
jgi:arylformamidase